VHVVEPPDVTLDGAQTSDDASRTGVTVTVVPALAPRVAVSVTVWAVATEPAVAAKLAELVAGGTVTDAGTDNAPPLLDVRTTMPPAAVAGWSSVTVHVLDAPDATLPGAHTSDSTLGPGKTVTVVEVLPPRVALTVTV
jgi:hypothetical protein